MNLGKKERLPPPFPFRSFSPSALPLSIDLALQPEGCKLNLGTMIKKVVLAMREKNLLCPPPPRTSLTLLVAPYFFITFCICQLYHTAKQPLFVRRSRTREWTNKRPGASSRAKIKCNTWEMREKYAFFSLVIHVAKLSRFARKSHEGALKKKRTLMKKP